MEFALVLQAIALVFLVIAVAVLLRRQKKQAEEFPESLKIFGPTSRTIGGPGNFKGKCGDQLNIFYGPGDHVISVTLENMGNCDIQLDFQNEFLMPSQDFSATVRAGAAVTRCGHVTRFKDGGKPYSLSTHNKVSVKCMVSESDKDTCRYRWRIDVIGHLEYVTDADDRTKVVVK